MSLSFSHWFGLNQNPYLLHIENCRNKEITPECSEYHKHHIIPRHWIIDNLEERDFCSSKQNLIILSLADHIEAHQILYDLYKRPIDKAAVLMLQGNKASSRKIWRRLGAEAVHKKLSSDTLKASFWNSDFQREMGQRSLNRPDALEIRSEAGKVGGRNRNLNRAIKSEDRYLFFYQEQPVLCCFSCETGGDVLKILKSFKETPLNRTTSLLNGQRKSSYGWSCEKI